MVFLKNQPLKDDIYNKCININSITELNLIILPNNQYKINISIQPNTTNMVFAWYGKEGLEIYQELIRRLELNPTESIQLPRADDDYQINKFLRR